jgi:DNA processing protein
MVAIKAWMTLCAIEGLGDATLLRLLRIFGSPGVVLSAATEELTVMGGLTAGQARKIQQGLTPDVQQGIEDKLKAFAGSHFTIVTCLDVEYPQRLLTIPDPPPLLYIAGTLTPQDHHAVAIVGSRRVTASGRRLTEELSRHLADLGFTIVSGLARGVDAAAHEGALASNGRTVAVLGCGADQTYPPEHAALRKRIEEHGAVISELPLGSPPYRHHFPRRNRIISGLSLGVLVTEAAKESGSLITARLAAEQGREVFALPGFIKAENSGGPNGLIKQGAKLVESVDDIVEELLPQLEEAFREQLMTRQSRVNSTPGMSQDETHLFAHLSFEPTHIDDLIVATGLSPASVASTILSMELRGIVHQLPGSRIVRI